MASGSCGTRDKLNTRAARAGDPTCSSGQRYLPIRDRFILVGFIWENAALHGIRILLQYADQRCFRKCGEKSQTSEQTGFFDDKTAVQ